MPFLQHVNTGNWQVKRATINALRGGGGYSLMKGLYYSIADNDDGLGYVLRCLAKVLVSFVDPARGWNVAAAAVAIR